MREMVTFVHESAGYRVIEAEDGAQGSTAPEAHLGDKKVEIFCASEKLDLPRLTATR